MDSEELNIAVVNEAFAENKAYMLEKELKQAQDRIKRLDEWKQSALEVEREWDANAVATLLGAKLGESQRKVIQREVPLLLDRIKRLEETLEGITNKLDAAWGIYMQFKEPKP
jgi:hypothetical protein